MTNTIETILIDKYRYFYNIPALNMFDQDDDRLDDLHTEVELLGGYIAGFMENYIKTKKVNWTKKDLQKRINSLKQKIKNINSKKVKEKSLFKKYQNYTSLLMELMDLMIQLKEDQKK